MLIGGLIHTGLAADEPDSLGCGAGIKKKEPVGYGASFRADAPELEGVRVFIHSSSRYPVPYIASRIVPLSAYVLTSKAGNGKGSWWFLCSLFLSKG